jgi:hypothetical protein
MLSVTLLICGFLRAVTVEVTCLLKCGVLWFGRLVLVLVFRGNAAEAGTTETLVSVYHTTYCHLPEDENVHCW